MKATRSARDLLCGSRRREGRWFRPQPEPLEGRALLSTILVDSLDDDGPGTLRQAIRAANATAERDVIRFAEGVTGVIQLETALPDLRTDLEIQGPGAGVLEVRGRGDSGGDFRIFTVRDAMVVFVGLTVANGHADYGGGIAHFGGSLTLRSCTITGNVADSGGGGLYSQGDQVTTTIRDCLIAANRVAGDGDGGGVSSDGAGAVTTIRNSTIVDNGIARGGRGGGLFSTGDSATMEVRGSLIAANSITHNGQGGGIYSRGDGVTTTIRASTITENRVAGLFGDGGGLLCGGAGAVTTIRDCVITGNTLEEGIGGGLAVSGMGAGSSVAIAGCTIARNSGYDGGGLQVHVSGAGVTATVRACLITDNRGVYGGGLNVGSSDGATTTIRESTLVGNEAAERGGGLDAWGDGATAVRRCLIVNNAAALGGGIFNRVSLTVRNSLVFANTSTLGAPGRDLYQHSSGSVAILRSFVEDVFNASTTSRQPT